MNLVIVSGVVFFVILFVVFGVLKLAGVRVLIPYTKEWWREWRKEKH